jgi:DNA polymerase-3 subunit epsilon
MGIYYIYGDENQIIYIGKSNNIRKRILSHLTGRQAKSIALQKNMRNVTYSLTGGELVTLLKEQNEIKKNAPKFNRAMKYRLFPMGIRVDYTSKYPHLISEQVRKEYDYISVFKNQKSAKSTLLKWSEEYRICLQKTSLSKNQNACFNHKLKKCDGACVNDESPEQYQQKIESIITDYHYPETNFLLTERGRTKGEFSFIYIKDNLFKGYGYYELNHQIKNQRLIETRMIPMEENPDVKKLILSFLRRKKYLKLISLDKLINFKA